MAFPGPGKFGPRRKKPHHSQGRQPEGRPGQPQLQPTNDFVGVYERPQGPHSSGPHHGRHANPQFGGPGQSRPPRHGHGAGPGRPPGPPQGGDGSQRQPHTPGGPGRHGSFPPGHRPPHPPGPRHPRHPGHPGQRPGAGHPGQRHGTGFPGHRQGSGQASHRQPGGLSAQRQPGGFPGQRQSTGFPGQRSGPGFPRQRGTAWGAPPGGGKNQHRGKGKKKIVFAVRKKKRAAGKMDSWVSDRSGSWSSGG